MADEIIKTEDVVATQPVAETPAVGVVATDEKARPVRGAFRDKQPLRKKNFRRTGRPERARQEYDQKILNIRRVSRTATGGRRFSFSVAMILGNRKGSVGVGTGKGADTAIAIEKSIRDAKKNMIQIALTPSSSIAHRVEAKYSSARVMMMPAPGRGVVAGSAVRNVIELAGIKDITAKIFSPSKNKLNVARAAMQAFQSLASGRKAPAPVVAESVKPESK